MQESWQSLTAALIESAESERRGVQRAIAEVLTVAEAIPLDKAILNEAALLGQTFSLSGQDAIVLASVFSHLESSHSPESVFVNRNSRDFADPQIVERLRQGNCKYFPGFGTAYDFLTSAADDTPGAG